MINAYFGYDKDFGSGANDFLVYQYIRFYHHGSCFSPLSAGFGAIEIMNGL
jgi:hypothetical protein